MLSLSPTSRNARVSAIGLIAAVAFVGGQLLSGYHSLTERHVVCSEHGETLHLPGQSETLAGDSDEQKAHSGSHVQPAEPVQGGHEHEHCHLCPTSREPLALAAPVGQSFDQVAQARQLAIPPAELPAASNLYLFAPKTSPPA